MDERGFGFTEIAHTADWALHVWAPDLPMLFAQAAEGMYWLMETTLKPGLRAERALDIDGADAEILLVGFLTDLLYLGESEALAFDRFKLSIEETHLRAVASGAPIAAQKKEIKAVTYHNLAIQHDNGRYEVTIVFDV